MKNNFTVANIFLLGIAVLLVFSSCSGGLKDPLKAPELKGAELEDFFDSPIKYGPIFHNDHIEDIFYTPEDIKDVNVLTPRKLGTKKGIKHFAIILEKNNNLDNTTILFFEGKKLFPDSKVYEYTFTKLQQGELIRYQNKMNPILLEIFPNEYFSQIAREIEDYEKGEPEREAERKKNLEESIASFRTPEGWPKDSVYTSLLLLREGIADFKDYTVGQVFYSGKRRETVIVDDPKSSKGMQVITVTSTPEPGYTSKINIYLRYNSKSQTSLLEKIEILDGDGKKTVAETFEEKYASLLILLPYLLNEGNLGE
jgi:hypothetical protein